MDDSSRHRGSGELRPLNPMSLSASRFHVGPSEYAVLALPVASAALPTELTPVEREVLSVLVLGIKNRDIAARRGTSDRTVANQVQSIFRKLGVHSRAELSAYLAKRPLA
ncbi:MAG TPA: LuxR C-terminal-related transcriptional regulator [Polyangiaceae bacterium]|nr:LuxR C-terminal-related transcriptional regulator [Polyangiaceae bacterium]